MTCFSKKNQILTRKTLKNGFQRFYSMAKLEFLGVKNSHGVGREIFSFVSNLVEDCLEWL
jgi:hypothetical protein